MYIIIIYHIIINYHHHHHHRHRCQVLCRLNTGSAERGPGGQCNSHAARRLRLRHVTLDVCTSRGSLHPRPLHVVWCRRLGQHLRRGHRLRLVRGKGCLHVYLQAEGYVQSLRVHHVNLECFRKSSFVRVVVV